METSVDAHRDQGVFVGLITGLMQEADHFRRDAVNPERDQFFRIGSGQTSLAQRVDKFAADIENAKCDELIGVQAADIFRFYLFGKGNRNIQNGHRELFIVVDTAETER